MYNQIYNDLRKAFEQVKKNKGACGIDKQTIESFAKNTDKHIYELRRKLKQKTYRPLPVRRAYIPKANKKKRPLGIPAVRDRIVQQALLNVIESTFEQIFHDSSYGFRPNRSAHFAVQRVEELLDKGNVWVVDADIEEFFEKINHDILINTVRERIQDENIINLIKLFLRSGIMEEGTIRTQTAGTPQGGVISPLLANIYLNSFDHDMAIRGYHMVRYADDFVILTNTSRKAYSALSITGRLLARKRLKLNLQKTKVTNKDFEFLGFHFFRGKDGNHYKTPRNRSKQAFKDKVRHITRRQQPRNIEMVIEKLNPIIRGWGNYYRIANVKSCYKALDSWIRMRLRSFVKKKRWVSLTAHLTLKNEKLRKLGLVSLTDDVLSYQLSLLPAMGQRYRKAGYGKSVRPV